VFKRLILILCSRNLNLTHMISKLRYFTKFLLADKHYFLQAFSLSISILLVPEIKSLLQKSRKFNTETRKHKRLSNPTRIQMSLQVGNLVKSISSELDSV